MQVPCIESQCQFQFVLRIFASYTHSLHARSWMCQALSLCLVNHVLTLSYSKRTVVEFTLPKCPIHTPRVSVSIPTLTVSPFPHPRCPHSQTWGECLHSHTSAVPIPTPSVTVSIPTLTVSPFPHPGWLSPFPHSRCPHSHTQGECLHSHTQGECLHSNTHGVLFPHPRCPHS